MSTAQQAAQAVEVCFRTKGTRRQVHVRAQGQKNWLKWSVPRADLAVKRGAITIPGLVDAPVVVVASLES